MNDLKIVLFICNWGPHAAFQMLQDSCRHMPHQARMIRIPCSGRMSRALLFKLKFAQRAVDILATMMQINK